MLKTARERGVPLPGVALVHQLLSALEAQGRGEEGTQALLTRVRADGRGRPNDDGPGASARCSLDLEGTVYQYGALIPGAVEALAEARGVGSRTASSRTPPAVRVR